MSIRTAIFRAARAMREDKRLYMIAISSLTIAFLCLAMSVLAITNLAALAELWGRSGRMSLYLHDGAAVEQVERLELLLESLPEVTAVERVTSEQARDEFMRRPSTANELDGLPVEMFPASLELSLASGIDAMRLDAIAERVMRFGVVEDVETYRESLTRLQTLIETGKAAAAGVAILVVLCVFFVVANTIRLSIASRRQEIEVLKLCGASDRFVQAPFVVEGAFQGMISALLAILILLTGFLIFRAPLDDTLTMLTGVRALFIPPVLMATMVAGSAALGAAGSALSLRRYMSV